VAATGCRAARTRQAGGFVAALIAGAAFGGVPSAWALDLVEDGAWTVPGDAHAVVIVDGRLAVVGAAETWALDPADGTVLATAGTGGDGAIARDPDGTVWICGDAGVTTLPWTSAGFGDAALVAATPCRTLVGTADGIATADDAAWRWVDDGADGLGGPTNLGVVLTGAPLLAWDGTSLAAASVGSAGVDVVGDRGVSTLATGGTVSGLGILDGTWAWTRPSPPALVFPTGATTGLAADPGAFTTADVDADGLLDTLVLHPGAVGVLSGAGGAEETFPTSAEAFALATADVDGDGCAEVFALAGDVLVRLAAPACGEDFDLDGDGHTPADGDCDDADDWTYTGAEEVCDGVDNDCDGRVDGVGALTTAGGGTYAEGTSAALTASIDGCADGYRFAWDFPDTADLVCASTSAASVTCIFADDGTFDVSVTLADADGAAVAEGTVTLVVENQPPVISSAGDQTEALEIGDVWDHFVVVSDLGGDPITLTPDPPLDDLVVRGDELTFTATTAGVFHTTLHASDGDGGEDTQGFTFTVTAPPPPARDRGPFGCGGGDAGFALVLLVPAGLRRRKSRAPG
jgi:hypothetical protein